MLPIPEPIAFTIFGIEIHWYAITMVAGIIFGFLLVYRRLKTWGISEDDLLDFIIIVVPICILGSRLYYVLFNWSYYSAHPDQILAFRNGGMAIHGTIIASLITAWFFCRHKKIPFFKLCDLCAPGLALGQAIGRWGNYFNMEAHGSETTLPWAIPVIEGSKVIYVHPTFLYESILDLMLVFFLLWYEKKKETRYGEGIAWYLILYSTFRFFIEGLRTDSLMFLGLRQAQLISLALIILGIVLLVWLRKHGEKQDVYPRPAIKTR